MAHRLLPMIQNDPRHYQIAVLTCLLIYGIGWLDFEVGIFRAALILAATLLTQYLCTRLWKLSAFDPRSSLISGLSLCLLLRTNQPVLAAAAAFLAIASKFVIRIRGKHLFNPTNFGLVALMLLTDQVWVSAGQWGSSVLLAFLLACVGGLVVNRAGRSDVSLAFLVFYSLILFGRSCWLGEPLSIPLHRLQSGALLLFSFFMISDPKTTPNSRAGRVLFALLVAVGAGYVQFVLFRTNGLLWSLAAFALAVPALDRCLAGNRYQWSTPAASFYRNIGGVYETSDRRSSHPAEPVPILPQRS
jgi:Na+-transporting NADH:ubiquinone oxidoreductase subunit NqrB